MDRKFWLIILGVTLVVLATVLLTIFAVSSSRNMYREERHQQEVSARVLSLGEIERFNLSSAVLGYFVGGKMWGGVAGVTGARGCRIPLQAGEDRFFIQAPIDACTQLRENDEVTIWEVSKTLRRQKNGEVVRTEIYYLWK